MNRDSIAVALVRKNHHQKMCWLARLNPCRMMLEFVIGDRLEGESFRETTIREVAWALELDRQRDFLVSNMAQMNLEFVDQLPGRFQKSHVQVAFYNVEIYRQAAIQLLDQDSKNIWVSSGEICKGVTVCGRKLDPVIPYLVNRSNVIQHWESSSGN